MANEKIDFEKDSNKEKASDFGIRILRLFEKINSGGVYSKEDLREYISEYAPEISDRTLLRDLKTIREQFNYVLKNKKGEYYIDKSYSSNSTKIVVNEAEILSLHILKAQLKTFKNTYLTEEIDRLTKKLDLIAPGDFIEAESFYWDQNVGQYDYTQSAHHLKRIIKNIQNSNWSEIEYINQNSESKKMHVLFRRIFQYQGNIYIAVYVPKHKSHITLRLQNIISIDELENVKYEAPEFDEAQFKKNRFGVYDGKLETIKIKIDEKALDFFNGRSWHATSKIVKNENGEHILTMKAPIAPDLIGWILSWGSMIQAIEPKSLIDAINKELDSIKAKYQ